MVLCAICRQDTRWLTYCPSHYDHERLCLSARLNWESESWDKLKRKMKPSFVLKAEFQDKFQTLNLQPKGNYPMPDKVKEVFYRLYSLPIGYIKSIEQANQILEEIRMFLGGLLIEKESPDFKYLLAFYHDLACVMMMRSETEKVKNSMLSFILEYQVV